MDIGDNQEGAADPNQLPLAHGNGGDDGNGGGDVERAQQMVNFLRNAAIGLQNADEWVGIGLEMIGDAPGMGLTVTRVRSGLGECHLTMALARVQLLAAMESLEGWLQAPGNEPVPEVMDAVREAHDVINMSILSHHGFLMLLVMRRMFADAVAQFQMGLARYHLALRHCHNAFGLFENDDEMDEEED